MGAINNSKYGDNGLCVWIEDLNFTFVKDYILKYSWIGRGDVVLRHSGPLSPRCVLSHGTQRCSFSRHQSEKMRTDNFHEWNSNPQPSCYSPSPS